MNFPPNRDKGALYPPFAKILDQLESLLADVKLPYFMFEGFRSFERQEYLYSLGRTAPGKIVTNAKPGQSLHFYGLAADFVPDGCPEKPGIQWSWQEPIDLNADGFNDWKQFADLARGLGLDAGFYWPKFTDPPHVQMHCGLDWRLAKELREEGGLTRVWMYADEWLMDATWP
ncbi:MAG: M15 family metallopeptidase [Anaerolineales bacterium]|nr:M15 family metallopeptidase [Anaerolineales bacterium]